MDLIASLNTPELLAAQREHLARLEALYAGERLKRAFVLNGIAGHSARDAATDPAGWAAEALQSLAKSAARASDRRIFRPLCLERWFFGVHFVDAVLGAKVFPASVDGAGDWWAEHLATPVGTLPAPDLKNSAIWQRAQALAHAMAAHAAAGAYLSPQVLASPLNIAVNLYGEEFLVASALELEAVRRDLRVITDTIVALTRWYLAALPAERFQPVCAGGRFQPRGFGQICGCTTQLVSTEFYRQNVAPLDAEVLGCYPHGGMIHLCGSHGQHLETWRAMPQLRAVQLNDHAADDFPRYFHELRDDQIIYLNPTEKMTVERALAISAGRRLVLVADLPDAPAL